MRIQKLFASKPGVRYSIYGLSLLALLTLAVARPLYRAVAASGPSATQKGVIAGPEVDKGALAAERAALQAAIESGTFELMSSAKQTALLFKARMRYEGGVLKPIDQLPPAPPVSPAETLPPGKDGPAHIESPLAALANPLVNNPALDATLQKTQSETSIIVTGANSAVTAFNDSGSFLGGVNSFTGYSTSTDMGTTWADRGIVPLLGDQNFGDPVLARSAATGTVFLATLAGGANGMNIYRSTDSGVTFSSLANGAPGASSADTDKEWITVDNFAGTGNGFVYHAYRDFGAPNGIFFTRSTNDGVTYSAPISIASGAGGNVQGAFTFVGADHAVYVGFFDSAPTPDRIAIRKSTDQGLTFAAATTVSNLITTGSNGSLNVPAGYRSSAFPQFVASPTTANLLFCVHPDITVAGGSDSNIFFQQSTDGGVTWSANQKLNTDAGVNAQTQPAIAIMPDGTALSVTWQDSRADAANRQVQRFGVIGTISGSTVTFSPNFQVSQPLWSPVFGADPVVVTTYMGDYDTMSADNSFFYTTFVDCRLGDQDVRFAKIPKAGPGAIIGFGGAAPTNLAVATNTCNDLFVTLVNNGTATANAVSATFTTATPGVTLLNATQNYGNIAPGASVVNPTAIQLSIANTFVCGTTIVINATVSTGETFSFNITTQGLGYQVTTMTGQTIVPGTVNVGNSGDDVTTNIAIPFTFSFYGQNFTAANVSSNGNLQFSSSNTAFTNVCPLPAAALNNLISPHWDDLLTNGAGSGIFTSVSGMTPSRIFNIEWRATHFSTLGTFNFEIRLYETTGQIDFVYGTISDGINVNGNSATVGIQKGTGSGGATDFTQFSCNAAGLSPGLKVSFNLLTNCPTGTGPCVVGGTPCVLTCPANITTSTTLNQCGAVVNYPAPTTTGTCGIVTCTPATGSFFPKGTTTVTCTGTGAASPVGDLGAGSSFAVPDGKDSAPTGGKAGSTVGGTAGKGAGPGTGKVPAASYNGGGAAPGHVSPGAPASPFAVLYDQNNNASGVASGSQNFEAAFDAFDDEVADDFVVPAGVNWTVNQVFADGVYFNGFGPATSVNVVFYSDSATLPGAVVATRLNQTFGDVAGDFTVNLAPAVVLSPGTYWVEVQANQDFTSSGQWGWTDRTVTSNSGSAWRNAGGGFGVGCSPGFGRKTTCIPTAGGPDQVFQILGTSAPLSTCTFTITVNDTQAPSITCPPNISAALPTPGATCVPVTYCPPTVTDNCPGVTFACVPPSGSCFVPGTTTVTCTATDTSGNMAACSFTVTVFNVCIQDDTNPNNVLLFITSGPQIGSYRFCCDGTTFTGVGTVKQIGSTITLMHQPVDRRVQGTLNIDGTGTASLQAPPGTLRCTITDRPNIGVHTCICGSPGSGCN